MINIQSVLIQQALLMGNTDSRNEADLQGDTRPEVLEATLVLGGRLHVRAELLRAEEDLANALASGDCVRIATAHTNQRRADDRANKTLELLRKFKQEGFVIGSTSRHQQDRASLSLTL